jgi:predicted transcriptional regulator
MEGPMIISRIMTKNPIFVHPDISVYDARSLMDKDKIGRLPVLDKNHRLVGIVTRKDTLKAGPSLATSLDIYEISYLLSKLKVEKIMVKQVITVAETSRRSDSGLYFLCNRLRVLLHKTGKHGKNKAWKGEKRCRMPKRFFVNGCTG